MKGDEDVLPPYELQNKKFSKALKGYSMNEVDEHLAFVIAKYTELYAAYNELERKFSKCEAELNVCRKNEEAASVALMNARNEGQKTIETAEKRANEILESAKNETNKILAVFKEQIKAEKDALRVMHASVADFRDSIYSQYQQHIEFLESIVPDIEPEDNWDLDESQYGTHILHQIQLDVARDDGGAKDGGVSGKGGRYSDEIIEKLISEKDKFDGLGRAASKKDILDESDMLIDVKKTKKKN